MNKPKRYSRLRGFDQTLIEKKYVFKDALSDIIAAIGNLNSYIERNFEGLKENNGEAITIRFTLGEVFNIVYKKHCKLEYNIQCLSRYVYKIKKEADILYTHHCYKKEDLNKEDNKEEL